MLPIYMITHYIPSILRHSVAAPCVVTLLYQTLLTHDIDSFCSLLLLLMMIVVMIVVVMIMMMLMAMMVVVMIAVVMIYDLLGLFTTRSARKINTYHGHSHLLMMMLPWLLLLLFLLLL